jgi:type I restriction enzyme, S subunit
MTDTQWQSVVLADVCSLRVDAIAPQDALEMPYVGLEHIDSGQPTLSRTGNAAEVRSGKSRFQSGDVLYGKLRPYLDKAVLAPHEGMCSTDILVLNPNERITAGFLVNLLHSQPFIEHAVKTTHGVNHPRTAWSGIGRFEFSLPPLLQQRAISHVLQTVQKAKEARQREVVLERERKAALMEHLFTHGTRGEPIKFTEIGELPESWNVVRLADICRVKTSFPSFSELATLDSRNAGDVLVLGLKVSDMNLPGNETYIKTSQNPFRIPAPKVPSHCLRPRSIVFPKRGAAIATNKKRVTTAYSVLDPNLIGVETSDEWNSEFAAAFFERFDLRTLQDNTPIPQLNKHNVEAVLMPLPSRAEQGVIAEVSVASIRKIAALVSELEMLEEFSNSLLEQLMGGHLDVSKLTDGGMVS